MPHREYGAGMQSSPLLEYVQAPVITPLREYSSLPESFITKDTKIKLHTATADCRLFFTTDGSEPDVYSNSGRSGTFRYRKPFSLNVGQRTLRALAISRKGAHQSAVTTKTFLVRDHIQDYVTKDVDDVASIFSGTDSVVSEPVTSNLTLEELQRRDHLLRRSMEQQDRDDYLETSLGRYEMERRLEEERRYRELHPEEEERRYRELHPEEEERRYRELHPEEEERRYRELHPEEEVEGFFLENGGDVHRREAWIEGRHQRARSRSLSPHSGRRSHRQELEDRAFEAYERNGHRVHFEEEPFSEDRDSDLDTEVLLRGFGTNRSGRRSRSPVSDVYDSRPESRLNGMVIDPDLPVFERRTAYNTTSDDFIDDDLEEELEEITESEIMTSRSEEERREAKRKASAKLEKAKKQKEINKKEKRKEEKEKDEAEESSESSLSSEEDVERPEALPPRPMRTSNKNSKDTKNNHARHITQGKRKAREVRKPLVSSSSGLSSSDLSSARSSDLSSARSSDLSSARSSEMSTARSSTSFSSISSLSSISSAATLAKKEKDKQVEKQKALEKQKVLQKQKEDRIERQKATEKQKELEKQKQIEINKQKERDKIKEKYKQREIEKLKEKEKKKSQSNPMTFLASVTDDLEKKKEAKKKTAKDAKSKTEVVAASLSSKPSAEVKSKVRKSGKSTDQPAKSQDIEGQLNFNNESGTQINFWGVTPDELLQGVKNRVDKEIAGPSVNGHPRVPPLYNGNHHEAPTIPNGYQQGPKQSKKHQGRWKAPSIDDFLSSSEEETEQEQEVEVAKQEEAFATAEFTSDEEGTEVQAATLTEQNTAPQAQGEKGPILASNQKEQHSILGFFKRLFGIEENDPDSAESVGRLGNGAASNALTYSQIVAKCTKAKKLWEDKDFPAEPTSMFFSGKAKKSIEWKRPHEICSNPKMFVGGASRFDVKQGVLGNCWLLAALASLTTDESLLYRVVPDDQTFSKNYHGVFRFRFWQYGRWVEVCVDDRLPTKNGRLMYMHSVSNNEFWSPLLEKAYAKLVGCYEALTGGLQGEAMEDFSGGIVESFNFRQDLPSNMHQIMMKAKQRCSLIGCSIDADAGKLEDQLENGLVIGHAYSVTNLATVKSKKGPIDLVRVRNPWGNEAEWNGPWSDRSKEWSSLSDDQKQRLGLTFDHDGEFWMSHRDFSTNFQRVEICNLMPGTGSSSGSAIDGSTGQAMEWNATIYGGSWKKKVNAGGCRNYSGSYWTNPQFRVSVTDPDDDDDEEICTVIVGLMQCGRRRLRREGIANLTIGYDIYDAEGTSGTLDKKYFKSHSPVQSSPQYINMREVCGRHRLPPGDYIVVPTTFKPGEEANFILRVFTEKDSHVSEIDEPTTFLSPEEVSAVHSAPVNAARDSDIAAEAEQQFEERAQGDEVIDAYELQGLLNDIFANEFNCAEFNIDLCRSILALRDDDQSGMLGLEEFKELWEELKIWQNVFNKYDTDQSGLFSSMELREALKSLGYQTSNATFSCLVKRFSNKEGHISFCDFLACVIKVKSMFAIHKRMADGGVASFNLDQFVQLTVYS